MFRAIRSRISPATVLAVVALVFAMTGGAFAVTGQGTDAGSRAGTAKAKSKGKAGPRGPAGPKGATGATGPAGSAGPAGPAGAKGETGAKGEPGAPGTNGKDGESVATTALSPGEDGCLEGGAKFTVGESQTTACNGEKGEAAAGGGGGGYPKTLPAGDTETGSFSVYFEHASGTTPTEIKAETTESTKFVPISFPVPLPIAIEAGHTEYVTVEQQESQTGPSQCTGTGEKPTAEKGFLCLYEGYHSEAEEGTTITKLRLGAVAVKPGSGSEAIGVGPTGALLLAKYEGTQEVVLLSGTWAVSAL
jgi:hypothetical protein